MERHQPKVTASNVKPRLDLDSDSDSELCSSHHPRQNSALTGKLGPTLSWRPPSESLLATDAALKSQSCHLVCLDDVCTLGRFVALSSGLTSCSVQTGLSVAATMVHHPLASSRPRLSCLCRAVCCGPALSQNCPGRTQWPQPTARPLPRAASIR